MIAKKAIRLRACHVLRACLIIASLGVSLTSPGFLECGTDTTSRMKAGATIMGKAGFRLLGAVVDCGQPYPALDLACRFPDPPPPTPR